MMEKEARTNKAGADLDKRNRNWEKLDDAVIVESGTNENGRYIKFGDGTMICTKKVTITAPITSSWGSVYSIKQNSIGATAATFAETPVFSAFCSSVGASVWVTVGHTESGNTGRYPAVDLVRPTAVSETLSYVVTATAIGRWK